MATMIPAVIDPATPSRGEWAVFERLRDDPDTADWIVLHSLGLADHDTQAAGEVDFLVIMPGLGILALEVKGCSSANLRRDACGLWYYGPKDKGDPRGPFKQAAECMHSIRRQLLNADPTFAGVQFSSGAVFPFAPFRERSNEWHDWEVVDSGAFRSRPIGQLLRRVMSASRRHLLNIPHPPHLRPEWPTPDQCARIRDRLRGAFELPVDPKTRAARVHEEVARFTGEQFRALDGMARNPRAIFLGPAGVGKTFLAIEAARRAELAGRRTLLLCYNRLLGEWLEQEVAPFRLRITARTIHKHMLEVAGMERSPEGAGREFWEHQLPERACDRLLAMTCDDDSPYVYDELIVDEAQDLMRDEYLDFLDVSLRGGLGAGTWRLFGDFENQAIYDSAGLSLADFQSRRAHHAPEFELRVNCRNTPEVAQWVKLLAGLTPEYAEIRRSSDGITPSIRFYDDAARQEELLVDSLETLNAEGFRGRDIVVLSTRADDRAAAARITSTPWRDRLRTISSAGPGHIRFASIHAFKGLEADAIVVTNIESITKPVDRALLYVATTRPLQRLTIIAHERVKSEARQILGLA